MLPHPLLAAAKQVSSSVRVGRSRLVRRTLHLAQEAVAALGGSLLGLALADAFAALHEPHDGADQAANDGSDGDGRDDAGGHCGSGP